ncbi:transketolase [Clostridiales bacterium COT073_COT-073]|nr:transketolase [Clostridiales bacterium COT073_COT-073]
MKMEQKVINTLRCLSADAVQKANSGHPGLPLGAAPAAFALWAKAMKHNPHHAGWHNRDRFILSAGHGSALLYSLLHIFDYGLTIEDLKQFRQWDSLTPGHPEYGHTVGVEATTGPLGAGFATAVGMAMAEAHLAAKYNKEDIQPIDHFTYVLCGDGCLMEGISAEAASLAGTLGLGKLIVLYDSNRITIEGSTDIAFTENVSQRFEAYHWQVLDVADGNDVQAIAGAIAEARKDLNRPTLIEIHTEIGYGSALQGSEESHGAPLGAENIKAMKEKLGMPADQDFFVDTDVREYMNDILKKGEEAEAEWMAVWENYQASYPTEAKELEARLNGQMDLSFMDEPDFWTFADKPNASRNLSGELIQRIADKTPILFGGSADLAPSTKTYMKGHGDFSKNNYSGRNLHFGVRELSMTAILNGIELHGGFRAYGATFFVFSDYMKPMIRLAALMNVPATYVLTHDSIGVGEDGPTHQPVEQLASLRSIPNVITFRPADAKETAAAWYIAMHSQKTPVAIVLTRQNLPNYAGSGKEALKGGYIISDCDQAQPDLLLLASGSEVEHMVAAQAQLKTEGIAARVISMPSFELFEMQSEEYKEKVMPKAVTARLAMEAGKSFGWHKYLGLDGQIISIEGFGASGPANVAFREFGFTAENAVKCARELVKK